MSKTDAKYRQYLETLGEDAVRHRLANQMLMTRRGELARAWLTCRRVGAGRVQASH
jgi:hypothetical protein